jgi:DNA polymerase-3 subunit chi
MSLPRVFFYHNVADRLGAACELLAKAVTQGKSCAVYVPDPEMAQTLDRLLWTQGPTRFVPHCRADAPLAPETPVLLLDRPDAPLPAGQPPGRLLNLDADVPPDFARFTHILEVVDTRAPERLLARQRFRAYKTAGCAIQSVDMAGP